MSNLLDKASILLTPTAYNNGSMLSVKPENGDGDFTFVRGSAATRVNAQGLVENVQIISSELVTNGNFSQIGSQKVTNGDFSNGSANWTLGNGWSIGEDKAIKSVSATDANLSQSSVFTVGKIYKIVFNIESISGQVWVSGISDFIQHTTTGVKTVTSTSTSPNITFRSSAASSVNISNISVKEVGQDWILGTGWSVGEDKAIGSSATGTLQQLGIIQSNKIYRLTYTILDYVSGSIRPNVGTVNGTLQSSNGTFTESITSLGSHFYFDGVSAFNGSVTNVSLKEVTDDTNIPRINYEGFSYDGNGDIIPDSGCGSYILENQSTNLIPYSSDFSQWTTTNAAINTNYITAPDSTLTAAKLTENTDNNRHGLFYNVLGSTSSYYSFSTFVKNNDRRYVILTLNASSSTEYYGIVVDLETGILTQENISSISDYSYKIEKVNDWYRLSVSANLQVRYVTIALSDTPTFTPIIYGYNSYLGTGKSIYIWGAQLEEQIHSTSYIPTSGATNTRNRDIATNSGNATLINSTEGVLYAEIKRDAFFNTFNLISLNNASSNSDANSVTIGINNSENFYARVKSPNGSFTSQVIPFSIGDFHKVAIRYEQGNVGLFIDGTKKSNYTGAWEFTLPLDNLSFDYNGNGGLRFFGKTKCLAVYKEALTDAELQSLTTI